jgi:chorismate mutase/prephenate dehydratase
MPEISDTMKRYKISIQGLPASNSENAALRLYPNAEIKYCSSFIEAINAVGKKEVDLAVLPYGNPLAGSVRERVSRDWTVGNGNILSPKKGEVFVVQKFLNDLEKYDLVQIEKYSHRIVHCLVGLETAEFEDIKEVWTHPMAFIQCAAFVDTYEFTKHLYEDTAAAAEFVAGEGNKAYAAIADAKAAAQNGLKIFKQGIADIEPNFTDFVVFTSKDNDVI